MQSIVVKDWMLKKISYGEEGPEIGEHGTFPPIGRTEWMRCYEKGDICDGPRKKNGGKKT